MNKPSLNVTLYENINLLYYVRDISYSCSLGIHFYFTEFCQKSGGVRGYILVLFIMKQRQIRHLT